MFVTKPVNETYHICSFAGIRSLSTFRGLRYLRIRFIDLDSPLPLMNPYFLMKDGKCSGIWSDKLVDLLSKHRPNVGYVSLQDGIGMTREGVGERETRQRPCSIKVSLYKTLADPMFHHM